MTKTGEPAMVVLGLTGSIGMGKSFAARAFARLGAAVYHADEVVHRLLDPGGGAVAAVAAAFPDVVRETRARRLIDRKALGAIVFEDPEALQRLEAILHPLVAAEEEAFLRAAKETGRWLAVLEIPLLFETGGDRRCDATLVVSAPSYVQRVRVLRRPGMTPEKLIGARARQMPCWEKRRRADFVIDTSGTRRASLRAVRRLVRMLRARRGAKRARAKRVEGGNYA
ncbi:MAG: dephospho-CoA kinase [Alphaproteobacteria bacterium]